MGCLLQTFSTMGCSLLQVNFSSDFWLIQRHLLLSVGHDIYMYFEMINEVSCLIILLYPEILEPIRRGMIRLQE